MKFRVVENVYTEFNTEKTFKKMLRKVSVRRPVPGLYVITEPLFEAGMMEIYNYNELLQPFYRKQKRTVSVLGMAKSRDGAKKVVSEILEDVYEKYNSPDINSFFKIGGEEIT
ncbi:MAG: hypothetical protein K5865_02310 [Eubacterium sp.]|nr:hypothetical protein [Eubacterium sp.]